MKKSIGVCEWYMPVKGPSLFSQLKSCGIDSFQMETGIYEEGVPSVFPEVQEAYLAAAECSKITINSAANMSLCTYGPCHPQNTPKYDAAKEIIEKSLYAVSQMQIPIFMIQSFGDGDIHDEDSFLNTAKMLQWASELGADLGVKIASENTLNLEDNLRLIEFVGMDNFGLGFDIQNGYALKGHDIPQMIRQLAGFFTMVHIKDGKGSALGMSHFGEGDSRFFDSIKALKESGYQGPVISENAYKKLDFYRTDGSPFAAIRKDVEIYQGTI